MQPNKIWHLMPYDPAHKRWAEYDIMRAMVVIAPTEEMARSTANNNACTENKPLQDNNIWLNPHKTQCEDIGIAENAKLSARVIISDFKAG